jgi:hypothetical protein
MLAADAFACERPRRDPPSSIRRPGSAIFVQYGPAPDLAPLHTSSLGLESQLLPQNRLLGGVHSVNLENVFRRIHANSINLFHGRPPLSDIYSDLILKEPEKLPRLRYFLDGYRRSRLYREISAARNQAVKFSRYWRICSCSIWARQCCSWRRGAKSSACLPSTIIGVIPIVRKLPLRGSAHTGLGVAIAIVKSSLSPFVVYLGTWCEFSITDRPAFLALDKAEGPPQKSKTSGAEVPSYQKARYARRGCRRGDRVTFAAASNTPA